MDLDDEPWPATLCGIGTAIACFAPILYGSIFGWNRSGSPDDVCGNPGIVFIPMGLVGGVIGGAVVGTLVTKLVSSLMGGPVGGGFSRPDLLGGRDPFCEGHRE